MLFEVTVKHVMVLIVIAVIPNVTARAVCDSWLGTDMDVIFVFMVVMIRVVIALLVTVVRMI